MDCSLPCSPDHRFPRQEYWNGLPSPSPGVFPIQGLNRHLLHWQVDSFTMNHQGSPITTCAHAQSCLTLCESMDVACQAPLSMEFSRQEYWSGLPFSPPGDLPDPGIRPRSPASPVLAGGFFTHCTIWEAQINPSYNFVQI